MKKSLLAPVLLIVLFTSILNLNTFGQKIEDVQSGNLLVSGVKVDGAISDWASPLKANNKSTGLAYTIANDHKYLYVAMQSTDRTNNAKILMGGITFTLNPEAKKKDKDAFTMTYPVITRGNRRVGGNVGFRGEGQGGGSSIQRTQEQRDSMQLAQAKAQLAAAKDIKVFGFKDITDSLISIYNEYGIKAATNLNDKGVFTYELAIPLALMNLSADQPKEFTYNIKLNGLQMNGFGGGGNGGGAPRGGNGGGGGFGNGGGFVGGNRGGVDFQALTSATDFWGKYTLAK